MVEGKLDGSGEAIRVEAGIHRRDSFPLRAARAVRRRHRTAGRTECWRAGARGASTVSAVCKSPGLPTRGVDRKQGSRSRAPLTVDVVRYIRDQLKDGLLAVKRPARGK